MPPILSVSDLSEYLRALFEEDFRLQDLWLRAEVSNLSRSSNGHLFFTLKDDAAQLRCVMWRAQVQQLDRLPVHGEEVIVHGRVNVYPASGQYQLYVDALQPTGLGALHAEFEALRDRLRDAGLFDRARRLPRFPRHIGIVTSPQAAAYRDVLTALERRWPLCRVTLAPSLVQGIDAPARIAAALGRLNSLPDVDVILLVRGGGSLEDLWAFNDEVVARAIWASRVPVVCGVGHETDTTIADFVADLRAPTPTAAAEMATPDRVALARHLSALLDGLETVMGGALADRREGLDWLQRRLDHLSPARQIAEHRRRTFDLQRRAHQTMQHRLTLAQARLAGQASRLIALDPYAVLSRGYAIVTDADTGAVVSSSRQVRAGRGLRVRVADGEFDATAGRQRRLLEE